jgi:hypothetical protein
VRKSIKIKYLVLLALLILSFVLKDEVLAIEPFKEEPPVSLPPGATPTEVEVLQPVEEVMKKDVKLAIERIHSEEAKIGETIEVTLKIDNYSPEKVRFFVSEFHKPGLEYPDQIEIKTRQYQGLQALYYLWEKSLEAGEEIEIKYHVKSENLGMILFSPAVVSDEYGNVFESSPTTLKITCRANKKCDSGENYIFCPEDCRTGSADGVCDGAVDDRCDPDCLKEADPDCQKVKKARVDISRFFPAILGFVVLITLLLSFFVLRFFKKK